MSGLKSDTKVVHKLSRKPVFGKNDHFPYKKVTLFNTDDDGLDSRTYVSGESDESKVDCE